MMEPTADELYRRLRHELRWPLGLLKLAAGLAGIGVVVSVMQWLTGVW